MTTKKREWRGTRRQLLQATAFGAVAFAVGCRPPSGLSGELGAPADVEIEYPVQLVGPLADWRAQDYSDSQGVTAVRFDPAGRCLVVDFDLEGKHEHRSKGEIVLDLKYVPTLERSVPVDMTHRRVIVDIDIPKSFIASAVFRNGCHVLVKDDASRAQYGTWLNCGVPGLVQIYLQPSTVTPWRGSTAPDFDPSSIRTIGIKFAVNDGASQAGARYSGQIRIKRITVTPDLPWAPPLRFPEEAPIPHSRAESPWECRADGFYVGGEKAFLVGGNWRGIEYGQNFGITRWSPKGNGFSKHAGFVAARLDTFRRAGVSAIRMGLLDDGRTLLDRDCRVVGMNDVFRSDVRTLLDLAARFNVKVELVLFDYLVGGREQEVDGVWVRGRGRVIEDEQVRTRFLDDFLDPFLQEFGHHDALSGFDVINEPEWIVGQADGGGWETVKEETQQQRECKAPRPFSGRALRRFITACAERIHRKAPGKPVTVGVSCKYLALVAGLDLDYLAPHYYPWMGDLGQNLADVPKGKPWMLEEFPGKGDQSTYYRAARDHGASGVLVWNLSPGIDDETYTFDEEEKKLQELRRLASESPSRALDESPASLPTKSEAP